MRITGKELNLAEDVFKLQHLLDCHLLKVRDDMEDLTTSAVKEEQIEVKLATVSADWAEINLVFADYKTRGTVILKVSNQLRYMSAFCLPICREWYLAKYRWPCHSLQGVQCTLCGELPEQCSKPCHHRKCVYSVFSLP